MKKLLACLLACAMLVFIASCEQTPSETTDSTPIETTAEMVMTTETTTAPEATKEPHVDPEPYKPSIVPSDVFTALPLNPEWDPEEWNSLNEKLDDADLGTVVISDSVRAHEKGTLLPIAVRGDKKRSSGGRTALTEKEISRFFMQSEIETLEVSGEVVVAMTLDDIENLEIPSDWALSFDWWSQLRHDVCTMPAIYNQEELNEMEQGETRNVYIKAYLGYDPGKRREALMAYYQDDTDPVYWFEEMHRPANIAFLERYELTELAKDSEINLSGSGFSLKLTKEQIEAIIADGYFSLLSIEDPDGAIAVPT